MKYIGSGLWACAAAYAESNGHPETSAVFAITAGLILIWGSIKSTVTINNTYNEPNQTPKDNKHE